jgi:hypothetical protein
MWEFELQNFKANAQKYGCAYNSISNITSIASKLAHMHNVAEKFTAIICLLKWDAVSLPLHFN